jgi:hypothetical protein
MPPTSAAGTPDEDDPFGQFQYPSVPLHVSGDFMNTALRKALTPAFDRPGDRRKEP